MNESQRDRQAEKVGYAASAPCGCTYALFMGAPSSDIISDMKRGAVLDRVTRDEGNQRLVFKCPHTPEWGGL